MAVAHFARLLVAIMLVSGLARDVGRRVAATDVREQAMPTISRIQEGKFLGPSIEEILSCIADAVVSTDIDGKILLFNPAAEKIFGYSASEVLGSSIHLLIPARFREIHASHIASFGAAPKDVARSMASERKVLGLRRDGTEFAAEAMLSCRHLGQITLLTVVIRDVSHRIALDEQRELIASEMAHRFKNIMAMVNSVIRLTERSVSTVEEFREGLEGRLNSVLRNQAALIEPGRQIQLSELMEFELAPFRENATNQISVNGPELTIPHQQVVSISLVLHELTTNAVKYGALSSAEGSLQVNWTTEQEGASNYVMLDWIETGGPPVTPPDRRGFGSTLIERSFGAPNTVVDYKPEGLTAHFRIKLSALADAT